LIDEGKISLSNAAQQILPAWIERPDSNAEDLAASMNLIQSSDDSFIMELVDQALAAYPDKVLEYKNGKKGLMGLFMGEVMKLSKGKADPKIATSLLKEKLDN